MDGSQFENLIRALTGPRRLLLGGGLASAAGWLGGIAADAKKKRKRKNRKKKIKQRAAEPNEFGCIDVGDLCQSAEQCCSGICEGKKGQMRCRAHDVGDCAAGAHSAKCGGADVACTTSGGAPGLCATTTGNAGYCSTYRACYFCTTDLDCQVAAGGILGPRAACIQCESCGAETGGAACATRDYIGPSPKSQEGGHPALHAARG